MPMLDLFNLVNTCVEYALFDELYLNGYMNGN